MCHPGGEFGLFYLRSGIPLDYYQTDKSKIKAILHWFCWLKWFDQLIFTCKSRAQFNQVVFVWCPHLQKIW